MVSKLDKRFCVASGLEIYKPVAEAISLLLWPQAEVIIHDFKTGCLFAVFNNLSKRKVGDESLLDDLEKIEQSGELLPPYFKTNWDGRRMKSVSSLLRNQKGAPIGLLCINLDISKWEQMHAFILGLIESKVEKPDLLFKNDWREKINVYVSSYLKECGLSLASLDRTEKKKLLLELVKEGALETKNAASYVAEVLQISRATLYNYLKEKT